MDETEGYTLVREVAVRYGKRKRSVKKIMNPEDMASFVRDVVHDEAVEHFIAIFLDGRHKPIAWRTVSKGTATSSLVHPREIFQPACIVGAVAVAIAHTHPSGEADPSPADRDLTRRISSAGQLMGIKLLDHVIVTNDDHWSFSDSGSGELE